MLSRETGPVSVDRPVIVLGTGRSGTSVVARVLEERVGIAMGGPGEYRPETPDGDWEDRVVRRATEQYHAGDRSRESWAQALKVRALERGGSGDPWGFKLPLLSLHLPELLDLFPHSRLVWAQRSIEDAAASFARAYGRPLGSCRNTVRRRWARLTAGLLDYGDDVLRIDLTEPWPHELLATLLRRWHALELPSPGPWTPEAWAIHRATRRASAPEVAG